jgi:hypothetical protein
VRIRHQRLGEIPFEPTNVGATCETALSCRLVLVGGGRLADVSDGGDYQPQIAVASAKLNHVGVVFVDGDEVGPQPRLSIATGCRRVGVNQHFTRANPLPSLIL